MRWLILRLVVISLLVSLLWLWLHIQLRAIPVAVVPHSIDTESKQGYHIYGTHKNVDIAAQVVANVAHSSFRIPDQQSENVIDWKGPSMSNTCIVMFDNRPAPLPSNATDIRHLPYLSLTLAANFLYAQHHGYRFVFYNFSGTGCRHPNFEEEKRNLPMTWCKLAVLEDAFFGTRHEHHCQLLLLLDSDAVISDFSVRLESFAQKYSQGRTVTIAHLDNSTMSLPDNILWQVHGVQRSHPWMFFSQPGGGNFLNAGVILFQRGDGEQLRTILKVWWNSASMTPPELEPGRPRPCWGNCLRNWPHEQAVFEIFVWPKFRDAVTYARLVPLDLMNGFSGKFVRHLWGLVKDRRAEVMTHTLAAAAAATALSRVPAAVVQMNVLNRTIGRQAI